MLANAWLQAVAAPCEPAPMAFVGEAIADAFGLRDMPNVTVIPEPEPEPLTQAEAVAVGVRAYEAAEAAEAANVPAFPVDRMAAYFARQAARGRQVAHA
jgi:hypothetical protein